ncbi:hypothetical protein FOCC_FOCC004375 [Frankliniella occidentalis]|nr:hypothetical protein FOCC_FOCC004375 [Frankliniella occidentalis]
MEDRVASVDRVAPVLVFCGYFIKSFHQRTMEWNPEQEKVLNQVDQMLLTRQPKLIRVEGPAASGKSTLLLEIASRTRQSLGPQSVLVLALTNTAADAVGGRTFHRALNLPVSDPPAGPENNFVEESLDSLGLGDVKVILIDNVHQVNDHVMTMALSRFRQEGCAEPFGGRMLVMFGDDVSWGPVLDIAPPHSVSVPSVIKLHKTYFKDESFGEAVERLKRGIVTEADSSLYEGRRLENLTPAEQEEFLRGPKVLVSRDDRDDHNESFRMISSSGSGAQAQTFARATGSPFERVTLWPGAPVVLTTTQRRGLEAGSQGEVTSVAANGVEVQFQGVPSGPESLSGDGGLPLINPLAYTVPTAQGLRFDKSLNVEQ